MLPPSPSFLSLAPTLCPYTSNDNSDSPLDQRTASDWPPEGTALSPNRCILVALLHVTNPPRPIISFPTLSLSSPCCHSPSARPAPAQPGPPRLLFLEALSQATCSPSAPPTPTRSLFVLGALSLAPGPFILA